MKLQKNDTEGSASRDTRWNDPGPKRALAIILAIVGVYLLLAAAVGFFDNAITGALGYMSGQEFNPLGAVVAVFLLIFYNIFGIGASVVREIQGGDWILWILFGSGVSLVLAATYLYCLTPPNIRRPP